MSISLEQEKIFDLSLYKDFSSDTKKKALVEDLAGLFLEAGDIRLEERINPRIFNVIDGKVIDPTTGIEVNRKWKYDTELLARESRGAEKFYNLLLGSVGVLVINISPPEPYKETRINVGFRRSETEIEFYGIPSHFGKIQCLRLAIILSEFSDIAIPDEPEDLRETAISIEMSKRTNPWELLREIAPIDSQAWEIILQGKPWQMKGKVLGSAERIVQEEISTLGVAETERELILIGSRLEVGMQKNIGWGLLASACPGVFNSQLLGIESSFYLQGFIEDVFGNTRKTRWEYHTGDCQNCRAENVQVGPCKICKKCEREYSKILTS